MLRVVLWYVSCYVTYVLCYVVLYYAMCYIVLCYVLCYVVLHSDLLQTSITSKYYIFCQFMVC